jgi:hypothetical protein
MLSTLKNIKAHNPLCPSTEDKQIALNQSSQKISEENNLFYTQNLIVPNKIVAQKCIVKTEGGKKINILLHTEHLYQSSTLQKFFKNQFSSHNLTITFPTTLTDNELEKFFFHYVKYFKNIKTLKLKLKNCINISDKGLQAFLVEIKSLKY